MTLKTVMVVDDSEEDRFVVSHQLEKTQQVGEIIGHAQADEALNQLRACVHEACDTTSLPALILVDLHMPLVSGLEFISQWRSFCAAPESAASEASMGRLRRLSAVPIYLLTSAVSPAEQRQAAGYDVTGFIEKPPSVADLTAALNGAVLPA